MLGKLFSRGKVISVRPGSNPNSSSLGVDVSWLLAGGAFTGLLTLLGGTLVRFVLARRRKNAAKE